MIPDWQLPHGVDRGLWDYLHSADMVSGYDDMMRISPLAAEDVRFCEAAFPTPGRLIDLGCGTGRLGAHFAARGFACTGVDLSPEMLTQARANAAAAGVAVSWLEANLADLSAFPDGSFEYAACLFSTLGMVRGADVRHQVLREAKRVLVPGGRLVLHAHNRYFHGLGRRGWFNGDVTMPQAYAGAPLTLHHFSRRGAAAALGRAGFRVLRCESVGVAGPLPRPWLAGFLRAYGFLFLCEA